jgi:RimJ/RimL family protein N-acetyltransferase
MRTLFAAGCTLEPLTAAHAGEMFQVLRDPAIYEFENEPPPDEQWLRARYQRLERRGPPSGTERWLNWVIRLDHGELAGYVQATVRRNGTSLVAYELGSRYWRRGIATAAVRAMLMELADHYDVRTFVAVLKARNDRSMGLLRKLGFVAASTGVLLEYRDEPDEIVMVK